MLYYLFNHKKSVYLSVLETGLMVSLAEKLNKAIIPAKLWNQ